MPFCFLKIAENRTRKIYIFFAILVVFYFLSTVIFAATLKFLSFFFTRTVNFQQFFSFSQIVVMFFCSLLCAFLHWYYSLSGGAQRIITLLNGQKIDKDDQYHQKFQNVIDELNIACGGQRFQGVVLPIIGMNAFSVSDLRGLSVIGVTEGILAQLTRAQLEAVVAHEAAHILSKDTLIKTIGVSLFSMYAAIMSKMRAACEGVKENEGMLHPAVFIIWLVSAVLYVMGKTINLFISRECEYRADAVAVRLVRDPYSLAQALSLIHKKWRGGGSIYDGIESLFILNPSFSRIDEQEGWLANFFSTHPPIRRRIEILLELAHIDYSALTGSIASSLRTRKRTIHTVPVEEMMWYIARGGREWQGPFTVAQLLDRNLIHSDCFVRRKGDTRFTLAYYDETLVQQIKLLREHPQGYLCPRCFNQLAKVYYEGMVVLQCQLCKGVFLHDDKRVRVIIRQEQGFSGEVIRKAQFVRDAANNLSVLNKRKFCNELKCPQCQRLMVRSYYSLAYPIEVDRCFTCNGTWFDKDELEILQYLVESQEDSH